MKRLILLIMVLTCWNLPADSDLSRLGALGFSFPQNPMTPPGLTAYQDGKKGAVIEEGTVTILYFWSSLTPPSLSDLPLLENLQNRMGNEAIKIAAVNLNEDFRTASEAVSRMNLTIKLYYFPDPEDVKPYILHSVPAAYILNRQGKLVASIQGNASWDHPDVLRSLKELSRE